MLGVVNAVRKRIAAAMDPGMSDFARFIEACFHVCKGAGFRSAGARMPQDSKSRVPRRVVRRRRCASAKREQSANGVGSTGWGRKGISLGRMRGGQTGA